MLTTVAYAEGELEKAQNEYNAVLRAFSENLIDQNLLVEGFKSSNRTFQALLSDQQKLQEALKRLKTKIEKLQTPVETPEEVTKE
jgi:hypothetical protein